MKKSKFNIKIKIPKKVYQLMLNDLKKPHPFAYERVGFLYTKSKLLVNNTLLVLGVDYIPADDHDYIKDKSVGAKVNSTAIRKAMQGILDRKGGGFHVHLHEHSGVPSPSSTDKKGLKGIVESFSNISGKQANGILILSEDSFYASVKFGKEKYFVEPESILIVGSPMLFRYSKISKIEKKHAYDRQSFLGEKSQLLFENVKVGIVGYGGGGSHIGQQLAHMGVTNITIFDDDKVEETNLNRLIGAWFSDSKNALLKTTVAKRIIKKILPQANVTCINSRWQINPDLLQSCDIVIGCVDSYIERQQLELECRRYLIPYIDIGMDVHKGEDGSFSMAGQVILSMPGQLCMNCLGFITEGKLAIEAAKYGNVGGRPQVVWPNGVLASTAVGVFVDLVTGWTKTQDKLIYLSYDGNIGVLSPHIRLRYVDNSCSHYPLDKIGPPNFVKL